MWHFKQQKDTAEFYAGQKDFFVKASWFNHVHASVSTQKKTLLSFSDSQMLNVVSLEKCDSV